MPYNDRYQPRFPWYSYLWPLLWLLLLGGVLLWRFWPRPAALWDAAVEPRAVTPRGDLAQEEKTTIEIFRNASPSVVHITNLALHRDIFSLDTQQIPQGTGSGFLWDDKGHVVTNFHVIQGADAASVTLADHSTWKARLVGAYPDKDVAVLWIDASKDKLKPILVGSSSDLQVGQKVFAIGNPFGLDHTLTTGIVSALGREITSVTRRPIKDVIQTDAAINPGNSGGPLLDSAGRLIGVNTAIYSPSGASVGIGFAIPADEVNRIVTQLIRSGKVSRPDLGVQPAADQIAQRLRLPGVLIMDVSPRGPAARAGLRPTEYDEFNRVRLGDVIVAIDDQPIRTSNDLFDAMEKHRVGDVVTVTVQNRGQQREVQVKLEAAP